MGSIDKDGNIHRGSGQGGGQFAGRVNSRPTDQLSPDDMQSSLDALIQRRARLIEEGYAPASAGPSIGSAPRSTEGIDSWWEELYRRAELHDGSSYLQMPDDYTPGGTTGRALSGKRRTHRILYEGSGIALRMPSATAVRRFSQEQGGQTFDIPVQAEGQGGQIYSGYARVTQEAPGKWTVDAMGMPPQVAWKVSESVASVLEARRPSAALHDVGDLLQRRRERIARAGARIETATNSSWVAGMGYNAAAGEMVITLGNRTYGYQVPERVFHQVKNAYSAGAAYNKLVKNHAPRVEIDQCSDCQRWFNTADSHSCMRHRSATGTVKPHNERVRAHILSAAGPR
jgi:hypothetical protein